MDGRKNNKGKTGNNGGNPGYFKLTFITDKSSKILPKWWTEIEKMLKGKDKEFKKLAIIELNKIQVKMIPQDVTTGGLPFQRMSDEELKEAIAGKIASLLKK